MRFYSAAKRKKLACSGVKSRRVKPSQMRHRCGVQRKKSLAERGHHRACGADCSRGVNAAGVGLSWELIGRSSGQELSEVGCGGRFTEVNHESLAV